MTSTLTFAACPYPAWVRVAHITRSVVSGDALQVSHLRELLAFVDQQTAQGLVVSYGGSFTEDADEDNSRMFNVALLSLRRRTEQEIEELMQRNAWQAQQIELEKEAWERKELARLTAKYGGPT